MANLTFQGKNKDFTAKFIPHSQAYLVYYKGRLFATKYRKKDIEAYLN